MRAVPTVSDLGAVIAGLVVLLDRKGEEGMTKEEAGAELDAHVARLAAATAPGEDAADEADSAATLARADEEAASGTGAAEAEAALRPPSVLKF